MTITQIIGAVGLWLIAVLILFCLGWGLTDQGYSEKTETIGAILGMSGVLLLGIPIVVILLLMLMRISG